MFVSLNLLQETVHFNTHMQCILYVHTKTYQTGELMLSQTPFLCPLLSFRVTSSSPPLSSCCNSSSWFKSISERFTHKKLDKIDHAEAPGSFYFSSCLFLIPSTSFFSTFLLPPPIIHFSYMMLKQSTHSDNPAFHIGRLILTQKPWSWYLAHLAGLGAGYERWGLIYILLVCSQPRRATWETL